MDELIYKIWFMDIPINGLIKIEILKNNISPREFWDFNLNDYVSIGIDIVKSQDIISYKHKKDYDKICEYLVHEKIKLVMYNENEYPSGLNNIYNPPVGLFVKGRLLNDVNSIAIVGARRASEYGKTVAYKFSHDLAVNGISVVSGMARGIDSCAHKGCIDGNGYTIAVMGSGLKNIYPKENIDLYNKIADTGCIITEFLPDMQPLPVNFPLRNRIISAISKYVLVIEAGEKSGSLITASLALEQGKDIFAIPGNIFNPNSFGTNKLIKDGAKIIIGIEDVLEEYGISKDKSNNINLNEEEEIIVGLLKNGAITLEGILNEFNIASNSILASLSRLECLGIIKRIYGNYYITT